MFEKFKTNDSIQQNTNVLNQKNENKRIMYEQKCMYEKSLLDKTKKELEDEKQQKLLKKKQLIKENERLMRETERARENKLKVKC